MNKSINTPKEMLNKIAWLKNQESEHNFSNLQLQKFLFFYEMFQYEDNKEYDFNYLKAYKNGPVFSNFYGDITYRKEEVNEYLNNIDPNMKFNIDEENANFSKFLILTMTDTELSSLTHQFNMCKVHKNKLDENIKHIEMNENDINIEDKELLQFIKFSKPKFDYEIIEVGEKRFIFSKSDAEKLNESYLEILDSLSTNEDLINPVYVELSEGRVIID